MFGDRALKYITYCANIVLFILVQLFSFESCFTIKRISEYGTPIVELARFSTRNINIT